jgi:hypothetical protein
VNESGEGRMLLFLLLIDRLMMRRRRVMMMMMMMKFARGIAWTIFVLPLRKGEGMGRRGMEGRGIY